MSNERNQPDELSQAVARIHAMVLALVFALIGGLAVFVMTAWLLIKGGSNVGAHLQLLGQYSIEKRKCADDDTQSGLSREPLITRSARTDNDMKAKVLGASPRLVLQMKDRTA